MATLFDELEFKHGPAMKNRFMLAPLTNTQSHKDGRLSDEEFKWLVMRAKGGFGLTMTCAAHVQAIGQGFPGQLGTFSASHEKGLGRLATAIQEHKSLALVQLHHAGMRSPEELIGTPPLCPSQNTKTGARAMSVEEIEQMIEAFIVAAERVKRCGFDGVQIHGAHGYLLAQFLSASINKREDDYGGCLENRSRVLFAVIEGVRKRCGADFHVGLRLSPERFGQTLSEAVLIAQRALTSGLLDSLDMSVWDVNKEPEEAEFKGRLLRSYFCDLERGNTRLGLAGKIHSARLAQECLDDGYDFVALGRAAILHHDFPQQVRANADFEIRALPVTAAYLHEQGLSPAFVTYMSNWDGFVVPDEEISPAP